MRPYASAAGQYALIWIQMDTQQSWDEIEVRNFGFFLLFLSSLPFAYSLLFAVCPSGRNFEARAQRSEGPRVVSE